MKKILVSLFLLVLGLYFSGCDLYGKDKNVTCKKYDNSAVFKFDEFSANETISFELERNGLGEGPIYYQVNLVVGTLNINYQDRWHDIIQPLGAFSAVDETNINGSGGYVEGDKITIIFESDSVVIGEIIIAFTEESLKAVQGNLQLHKHTYSYTSAGEVGHYTHFTCGCPSEEGTTHHYDENGDYLCDACKCDMTEFANEWKYDETHHWYETDAGTVYCYGEHENFDEDLSCDICSCGLEYNNTSDKEISAINTQANFTFFPAPKSNLNNKELQTAYEAYMIECNRDLSSWGNYEIYNFTSEDIYNKYNLDVFEVSYEKSSYYFVKYNDTVYQISPFDLSNINSHCINHIAITDINNDGYIEILTAINSFADRKTSYYCASFIRIIDTKSKNSIEITDYKNINYFKENEEGIISIYNANGIMPVIDDLHNGILDEKYYNLATNLFDTPVLNTSLYEFKEKYVEASCDLFEVEITINDGSIKFPYLFKSTYSSPYFTINVKMTYLGDTFSYTSPDGYLDGAVVSFVNNDSLINCEGWGAPSVISKFTILTGMEIEREYRYHEDLNIVNEVGIYDMVITYENEETDLKESIVIKDFLQVTR